MAVSLRATAVSIQASVDSRDMARVTRVLNQVDKSIVQELRTTMRRALKPLGEQIAARANSQPVPMSGLTAEKAKGKWRWGKLKVSVSVATGFSRKSNTLVSLNYNAAGPAVGIYIAERAGSKNLQWSKNIDKGMRFVRRLNYVVPGYEKGGRYMFRASLPYHKHINRLGENLLERWIERTNRELENM